MIKIKKTIKFMALMACSPLALAEMNFLHVSDNITVQEFIDEFNGEKQTCQLSISNWNNGTTRLFIVATPGSEKLRLGGYVDSFPGSGLQLKIDDGRIYKYGSDLPGGEEQILPEIGYDFLDELSDSNEIIVRVHPENQFVNTKTDRYSIPESLKAVEVLKNCISID
ncbi:hypothetical protein [Vibrio sp. Vb0587]|uniref:hypothetical protein n=1 Tax=Vibrio sp. Vb0587 TaxID=3074626 RepID=UPI002964F946|nr:hypothetical protein [Vibrio sp. Vb0587]MDW1965979.1 hypothetical protein [Vibrio sp. Vb0587]